MKKNGTTEECLWHYLASLPVGKKGSTESRDPIAKFTGANQRSIREWAGHRCLPVGFTLVRVRYFLEKEGYAIAELEKLAKPIRQLGWLLAYEYVDADSAYKEIGLDNINRLCCVLRGERNLSSDRFSKIEQIVEGFKEELALMRIPEEIPLDSRPNEKKEVAAENKTVAVIPDELVEEDILHLLRGLKSIVALLAPRFERMLSHGVSVERRRSFRDNAGQALIFDLSNELHHGLGLFKALCSEKAREIYLTQNNQNQSQNKKKEA